jgi:hypothetical protein
MLTILQNEVSKYTKYHYFEPNTQDYSAYLVIYLLLMNYVYLGFEGENTNPDIELQLTHGACNCSNAKIS